MLKMKTFAKLQNNAIIVWTIERLILSTNKCLCVGTHLYSQQLYSLAIFEILKQLPI